MIQEGKNTENTTTFEYKTASAGSAQSTLNKSQIQFVLKLLYHNQESWSEIRVKVKGELSKAPEVDDT